MPQEVKRTITIETKKSENKLREFRKEMTKLRGELISLEEGTEEYNRVLTELANKQQKLNDVQEDIRNSMQDVGARIANLSRVTRGAVGGFTAIQGAINLLGASGNELEPMLKQMANLLAIIEGLEQVEGLTKSIPNLIASFKGFGKELSDWFGGLFGSVDSRIDDAANNISKIGDSFSEININTDFVEPLDEANKKIKEAGEGTRRITDFVEPIGSEVEKIKKSLQTVSVGGKQLISVKESLRAITTEAHILAGVGASNEQVAEKMSEAAKKLGLNLNKLLDAQKRNIPFLEVSSEATKNAGNGLTFMAKATNVASKAWKTLGYAMKTLGLTALVIGIAEAAIYLYNNWDKVIQIFRGKTKQALSDAAESSERLAEALAAVNAELYPETNRSKLADAHTDAIVKRINLEQELARLEKERVKYEQYVLEGYGSIYAGKLATTERKIANVKAQLSDIDATIKDADTALKTYYWREKQEEKREETKPTGTPEEPRKTPLGPVLTPSQRKGFIDELGKFLDERNELTVERNLELEKSVKEHYATLEHMRKTAKEQEAEFNRKRVEGIYNTVQAISDITYSLSQIYYASAQNDELTEEQRERRLKNYRKLLIATAAIDTAVSTAKAVQAAIGAMSDTPGPIWTRIAAWGTVLATGLSGVAQMVSAFNSVNLSSSTTASSVTPANIATPPVAYTRNLLTDEETDRLNQGTRVWVLESDITNAQNAVKVAVTNSTF